jgi:hypothetical protein
MERMHIYYPIDEFLRKCVNIRTNVLLLITFVY